MPNEGRKLILIGTDYGPLERAFLENPKILGLGRQIGPTNFGAFGVFSANLSVPIKRAYLEFKYFC